ncbi:MAG: hypothetical protein ACKKL5_02575 [Candidatus Komeilibacteria bacterium]
MNIIIFAVALLLLWVGFLLRGRQVVWQVAELNPRQQAWWRGQLALANYCLWAAAFSFVCGIIWWWWPVVVWLWLGVLLIGLWYITYISYSKK